MPDTRPSVDIGHRPGFTSVNYTIELRSGGTVLASTNQLLQPTSVGGWITSSLNYTTPSSVPYGLIQIVLRAPNNQVNFDNVRLRSTNIATKPAESYAYDANGNRLTSSWVSTSADGTHNRQQSDGT
ncbi:MAG: hypothetical protein ACK553_00650, partial [Planctomycetota bacterium]